MIQIPEEVKQILKDGIAYKNFRVKFPNGEHEDITNDNIISESVNLTESVCSQDTLKFGLCEASTLQFETFDVDNIKGKIIDCQLEVDCNNVDYFTQVAIDNYGNNINLGIKADSTVKVRGMAEYPVGNNSQTTAYINLYDVDITAGEVTLYEDISDADIAEGGIDNPDWLYIEEPDRGYTIQLMADDTVLLETTKDVPFVRGTITSQQLNGVKRTYLRLKYKIKNNMVGNTTFTYVYSTTLRPYPRSVNMQLYLHDGMYAIPYGRFKVYSCARNHDDMQRRRVEAYGMFEQAFSNNPAYSILKDVLTGKRWAKPTPIYVPLEALRDAFFIDAKGMETIQPTLEQRAYTQIQLGEEDIVMRVYMATYYIQFDNEWYNNDAASLHIANVNISNVEKQLEADNLARRNLYEKLIEELNKGHPPSAQEQQEYREQISSYGDIEPYYKIHPKNNLYTYNMPQGAGNIEKFKLKKDYSGIFCGYSETTTVNGHDYSCNVEYTISHAYKVEIWDTYDNIKHAEVNIPTLLKVEANRYGYITHNGIHSKYENGNMTQYGENEPILSIAREKTIEETYMATNRRTSYYHGEDDLFEPQTIATAVLELYGMLGMQNKTSQGYSKFTTVDIGAADVIETFANSEYSQAWYDDVETKAFSGITCTYHNTSDEEVTETYPIVSDEVVSQNPDMYQIYDISNNPIIAKMKFEQSQIQAIMSNIANHIANIHYMPADIDAIGLPYLETGDKIHIDTDEGGFDTIILRRTLSGIQSLEDNIESNG